MQRDSSLFIFLLSLFCHTFYDLVKCALWICGTVSALLVYGPISLMTFLFVIQIRRKN